MCYKSLEIETSVSVKNYLARYREEAKKSQNFKVATKL